jgi:methyl-accepting chemotaxis protein
MNQETIRLVQQSWSKVVPIAPQAATIFYGTLFSLDPNLKPLFRGDMRQQGEKLMQMIDAAVGKLDDLERLVPTLQNLGRRHAGYGVQTTHYETVGAALLSTLAQGLGDDFDDAVKTAWTSVYGVMAQVMIDAATSQRESIP